MRKMSEIPPATSATLWSAVAVGRRFDSIRLQKLSWVSVRLIFNVLVSNVLLWFEPMLWVMIWLSQLQRCDVLLRAFRFLPDSK